MILLNLKASFSGNFLCNKGSGGGLRFLIIGNWKHVPLIALNALVELNPFLFGGIVPKLWFCTNILCYIILTSISFIYVSYYSEECSDTIPPFVKRYVGLLYYNDDLNINDL